MTKKHLDLEGQKGQRPVHLTPGPIDHMIETFGAFDHYAEATREQFSNLTPRERRVLSLVAEGLTSPEIAAELAISRATVQNHRANIRNKLHITSDIDFVKIAVAHNLITL